MFIILAIITNLSIIKDTFMKKIIINYLKKSIIYKN